MRTSIRAWIPLYESVFQSASDKSLQLRAKNSILNNYALVRDFPKALQQIPDIVPLLSLAKDKDKHLSILTIAPPSVSVSRTVLAIAALANAIAMAAETNRAVNFMICILYSPPGKKL